MSRCTVLWMSDYELLSVCSPCYVKTQVLLLHSRHWSTTRARYFHTASFHIAPLRSALLISLYSFKIMLIKIQPDATVSRYLFTAKSLYMFRVSQHLSSGVFKNILLINKVIFNNVNLLVYLFKNNYYLSCIVIFIALFVWLYKWRLITNEDRVAS